MDRRTRRARHAASPAESRPLETTCPILSLPQELHTSIIILSNTQAKKSLRQVNRYFHGLVSTQIFRIQLDATISDHYTQSVRSTRKPGPTPSSSRPTASASPAASTQLRTSRHKPCPSATSASASTANKASVPSPPNLSASLPALRQATILPSFHAPLRKVLPTLPPTLTHITYRCPPRCPSHLHVLSLCRSLTSLELLHYQGPTLSPLSSLTSLSYLRLKAPSTLRCLNSLSTLTSLASLLIWVTEDVVASSSPPPLGLHAATLAPLASLPYLRGLELNLMESQGGTSLSHLTQLASVTLLEAYPATLSAVLTLTNLQELNIPNIARHSACEEWHRHPAPSFPHLTALVLPLGLATAPSCPATSTKLCHLLLDTSSTSPTVGWESDSSESEASEAALPPPFVPPSLMQLQQLPPPALQQQQQQQMHDHPQEAQEEMPHQVPALPAPAPVPAPDMQGAVQPPAAGPSSSFPSKESATTCQTLRQTLCRFPHHPLAHLGLIIRGRSKSRCRALLRGLSSSPWQPPHLALAMIPGDSLISNLTTLAPLSVLTTLHIRVVEDLTDRRIAQWNRMCVEEGEQRQLPQSMIQAAREWLDSYEKRKNEEQVVRELVDEAIHQLCPRMPQLRHVLFSKHEF